MRPWYLRPLRSKCTFWTPFSMARLATRSPTSFAAAMFPPYAFLFSFSIVDACAMMWPCLSSTTCA